LPGAILLPRKEEFSDPSQLRSFRRMHKTTTMMLMALLVAGLPGFAQTISGSIALRANISETVLVA
jgi:hypothetical protein